MKTPLLLLAASLLISGISLAQCSFTGLPTSICESAAPVTLTPTGSGLFSGPGIVGNTFDPDIAGPGVHTINYDESDASVYTVDQGGTYSPFPSVGTSIILGDDEVSGTLPIGFTFNFFGVTYTDFYISSNGFITFSNGLNSGCCSGGWLPTFDGVENAICWAWNDLYPPGSGSITYETIGTAPTRKLLVTFTAQFHCCSGPAINTGQIVLSESSNIIEIHNTAITNDGSTCTQGIENVDGTIGYTAAGRNSTLWTSTNDYVAFVPQMCSSSQLVQVLPKPNITGTATPNPACVGDDVTFTGSGGNSYAWDQGIQNGNPTPVATSGTYILTGTEAVNGCSGIDTVNLVVNPSPSITLSSNDEMFGNDGSINLTIWGGIPPYQFDWDLDGTGDNDDSNDLFGAPAGLYTVIMTDGNGCSVTASAVIGTQVGLEELSGVQFLLHPNPTEGQFTIQLSQANEFVGAQLLVVDGLGRRLHEQVLKENTALVDLSTAPAGTYFVKVVTEQGTAVAPISVR